MNYTRGEFVMKKELMKKLQLGIVSFSAIALLAACGTDDMEEPPADEEPPVEDPADEDPAEDPVEDEEDAEDPVGGVEDEEDEE